jgi:hypothetical protein
MADHLNEHPLSERRWRVPGMEEFGTVAMARVHDVERTRHAIETIVRVVGNDASELAAGGSRSLDRWTVISLLGGVESLCDYLGYVTEAMLAQADHAAVSERKRVWRRRLLANGFVDGLRTT